MEQAMQVPLFLQCNRLKIIYYTCDNIA